MHCESFRRWLSVWQALQRSFLRDFFLPPRALILRDEGDCFQVLRMYFYTGTLTKVVHAFDFFFFTPSQVFNLPCAIVFAFVYSLENSEGDKTGPEEEKSFKWMHVVWVITWKLAANAVFDSRGVCIPNANCTVTFTIWLKLCTPWP